MRDFRDAKAMAHTLRAALATQGLRITNSQSLELIAKTFGFSDWNTHSARIHSEAIAGRGAASMTPLPRAGSDPVLPFSSNFATAMHQALGYAKFRRHEYATLEHLLLALTEDEDALFVLRACNSNVSGLREALMNYLNTGLERLVIDADEEAKPTPAFQRVVQRAGLQARQLNAPMVTGASALVSIFDETLSPAMRMLGEQGVTRHDAASHLSRHGGKAAP